MERRLGDWVAGLEPYEQRLLMMALPMFISDLFVARGVTPERIANRILTQLPYDPAIDWDRVGAPEGVKNAPAPYERWEPAFKDLVQLVLLDGLTRSPGELLERRHVRADAGWRWNDGA